MKRSKHEGRFTVSGPGHEQRGAQDVGHGISIAQNWACEELGDTSDTLSYYVTAVGGDVQARVTKLEDGTVETVLL